jgi:hypothetical protein
VLHRQHGFERLVHSFCLQRLLSRNVTGLSQFGTRNDTHFSATASLQIQVVSVWGYKVMPERAIPKTPPVRPIGIRYRQRTDSALNLTGHFIFID